MTPPLGAISEALMQDYTAEVQPKGGTKRGTKGSKAAAA
jgi:hypothetical protein